MRILFLTPAFPPFPGGGERYAGALALHLTQRGHEVCVLTSGAKVEQDFWRGCIPEQSSEDLNQDYRVLRKPVFFIPGGRFTLFCWRKAMVLLSALPGDQSALLMKMARVVPPIKEYKTVLGQLAPSFDLLHGFNISWEYPLVEGWRVSRTLQTPFVITPFAHFGSVGRDRVALNSTMDHQRRMLMDADAVLTLTSIESQNLQHYGVTGNRLDVIGGGVNERPQFPQPDLIAAKYQLGQPFAIFIGRASYDKGALHAMEAVTRLCRKGVSLNLVLIGQSTPEFARHFSRLSRDDRRAIRPLGIIDEEEKHALLEASTMLLLPSRSDSFGIVLLEAWMHEKPVVGADVGGIPGVVDDGHNGFLVRFGDVTGLMGATERLLTDEDLRRRMGQHGREKIESLYTWEKVTDRVLANYHRVLAAD
ncbi:MAG: glycosyltransferase family 4 protein [Anaerolineae bacterium]